MDEDADRREALRAGIQRIWELSRPTVLDRIQVLANAERLASTGVLSDAERQEAEREAHKLAGSLGTFGFHDASLAANELEQLLSANHAPAEWAALIDRIRRDIASA
jgi:HPt (histidine-containing phosphotransfer) domain-containing protein